MKNKKHNWILVISCFFLVSSTFFISIDAQEETVEPFIYEFVDIPENAMGIDDYYIKTVNWSYFKQLFLEHNEWLLEYKRYSYSDWTDGSNYLTIERTWNDSGFWKFNLILDVPVHVYSARFTYACDLLVLNHVDRVDKYAYFLNYTIPNSNNETYHCFFDWSDMANISNVVFTHEIQNNKFWFRFKRDNVPSGHYEFDPTFGYEGGGSSGTTSLANNIKGDYSDNAPDDDGCATNITVYLTGWDAGEEVKCALYNYTGDINDAHLVSETEERTTGGIAGWYVFDLDPDVNVYSSMTYIVVVSSDDTVSASFESSGGNRCYEGSTYPNFENPIVSWDATYGGPLWIYCSYTVGVCSGGWENTCPVSSSPSPANKSTDVSIDVGYWNITINDVDGNTTTGNISCSNGEYQAWSGQANGTRSLSLSTLSYSTNYTVYVNFTDVLDVCSENETYWFVTEDEGWINTCPVSSSPGPANKSTDVSIDVGYWNITINDADGNTTTGNISCSNGNWSSWSSQANGTRSCSLSTLSYSTNYTVWVNFTDTLGICSENETYWFITEDESGICNCSNFFNESELIAWLSVNKYLKEDSEVEINLGTDQLLIWVVLILIIAFAVLGERAKKSDHMARGIYFQIVGIIGIFGGVGLAQLIAWYIPFTLIFIGGLYWLRSGLNFRQLSRKKH